ncbi:hypothetical protein CUC53_17870 [Aeromonas cavernicola]|uniref:TonB-dependent receptor n=2 Tax=Aeromonas cavernicola TaxID=1006623 RepID=A0A2H9U090_9GAMM|nr:hypothetical protein CUC53_17870 [Aeromonas cavernicola]
MDTPYPLLTEREAAAQQYLNATLQMNEWNLAGTVEQQLREHHAPQYTYTLNQWHYDRMLSPQIGITLGKKVMTWGVGFAFKPLDLIQQEDLRDVNPLPAEGVYVAALDHYSDTTALSLIGSLFAEPPLNSQHREPSLTLRWYQLRDDDDLYAIARYSSPRTLEFGAGFTHVIDDSWSVYGAALYQHHQQRLINQLTSSDTLFATDDPMQASKLGAGEKLLSGVQWSDGVGLTLVAEAWWNSEAYRKADWQRLTDLTQRQRALGGTVPAQLINGNTAWSSQAFLAENLLQQNLFLHLGYDDQHRLTPYAELQISPQDRSGLATAAITWQNDAHRLTLGARHVVGPTQAIYRQMPIKQLVWAQWCWSIL